MFSYSTIIDVLFPIRCLGCGAFDNWICDRCARRFCGVPRSIVGQLQYAKHLTQVYTFADYHEPFVSTVVSTFKYQFVYGIGQRVGELMAEQLSRRLALYPNVYFDAVVPVPSAPRRMRWRGFNQSEILAASIARRCGWPLVTTTVQRVRFTKQQTALPTHRRRRNVLNSFAVADATHIVDKRILLVDDVITTGATGDECARALLSAGAGDVWAVGFARG